MKRNREYYHTVEEYVNGGLTPLLEHISQYLEGKRIIPISKTTSLNSNPIFFTFSNSLLERFVQENSVMEKQYEIAIKYGFKGFSKGEKNGIFYQNKTDKRLIAKTDNIIISKKQEILEDLELNKDGLDALKKVKIVSHNPSGERVVGAYNTNNHNTFFHINYNS